MVFEVRCLNPDANELSDSLMLNCYTTYPLVLENPRGQGLGLKWIKQVSTRKITAGNFLTIEDESLKSFYLWAGFKLIREMFSPVGSESLMIHHPNPRSSAG